MQNYTHLHVHSQYSLLDGQASIKALVDKALADGMKGIALTDHGSMFGVKEFYNYVKKKNGPINGEIKSLKKQVGELKQQGKSDDDPAILELELQIKAKKETLFKPIIGCEM